MYLLELGLSPFLCARFSDIIKNYQEFFVFFIILIELE
jgi:hypothetical protein